MMQINLLPWREMTYKKQQASSRRRLIYLFLLPMVFFVVQHAVLNIMIQSQSAIALRLNKQLNAIRNQSSMVSQDEKENYLQLSASIDLQKHVLQQLLKHFGSLGRCHIHLSRMIYSHEKIDLIGTVTTVSELERWENTLSEGERVKILEARPLPGINALKFHAEIE